MDWRREWLDEVTSTSDVVRAYGAAGADEGAVVIAERQTAGRGRRGRVWHSPRGNLYLSILLRPARSAAETGSLALVIGLALREAIRSVVDPAPDIELKWPNDLLIDGAKIAGILLEREMGHDGSAFLIVGCGVNLMTSPELADYPATSLKKAGIEVDRRTLVEGFLDRLGQHYRTWLEHGFAPLRETCLACAWRKDQEITIFAGDQRLQGRFVDLDDTGGLWLQMDHGLKRFAAGEVASVPLGAQG